MPLITELDPILIEVQVSDPVLVEVDVPADVQVPDTEAVQLTVLTEQVAVEVLSPGPEAQAILGVGLDGWSPILAIRPRAADSALVLQVIDWVGGSNTKPDAGDYLGDTGLVSDIVDALNIKGADGTNGTNGTAIILGLGDPASNVGGIGDLYIDLSAFVLWDKSSGAWVSDGTFKATDGIDGDDGAPGATLRWGHGAPSAGLGADGDEYTDIDTWDVYGKEAGAWSALGNIKGAAGADGSALILGSADPDGSVGKDLDTFINKSSWDVFHRDAGSWSLVGNIEGAVGMPIPGQDGEDGQDAYVIPGPAGADAELIIIPGQDGEDGDDAPIIPGRDGIDGVVGNDGQSIPGRDGDDGEDAFVIPGPAGADGISIVIPGRDGEDGEDAFPIPGRDGSNGGIGADGINGLTIPGRDGEDGIDALVIPGPIGSSGLDAIIIPGRDGEDGESPWPMPGPTGAAGRALAGAIMLEAGNDILGITFNDAASINMIVEGAELAGTVLTYKTLAQFTLTTSVLDLYDVPAGTVAFIKSIHLVNKTAAKVSDVRLYTGGSGAANRLTGSFSIPANGWAIFAENGWRVYDSKGRIQ